MIDITYREIKAAIKKLIYDNVVANDKDVADKVGLDKSTLSLYLSGKQIEPNMDYQTTEILRVQGQTR